MKITIRSLAIALVLSTLSIALHAQIVTSVSGRVGPIDTAFGSGADGMVCTTNIIPGGTPPFGSAVPAKCPRGFIPATAYTAAMTDILTTRLTETNAKLDALVAKIAENTQAANESKAAMKDIATQMNEAIQAVIAKRFELLPAELLNDPVVKAKLQQLKEEILKDLRETVAKNEPKPADH